MIRECDRVNLPQVSRLNIHGTALGVGGCLKLMKLCDLQRSAARSHAP